MLLASLICQVTATGRTMILSATRHARKCIARIHNIHLLSDKVELTSYSTLAVVVEAWLACPTAFSAVVTSLRTWLSCNLISSHNALGFLPCTIQLNWKPTIGQRQLAGSSIKILLVLIQARDPVGFLDYAMFSVAKQHIQQWAYHQQLCDTDVR